jgi:hypothetical protein
MSSWFVNYGMGESRDLLALLSLKCLKILLMLSERCGHFCEFIVQFNYFRTTIRLFLRRPADCRFQAAVLFDGGVNLCAETRNRLLLGGNCRVQSRGTEMRNPTAHATEFRLRARRKLVKLLD